MKVALSILTILLCVQIISAIPWFYVRHNRWGHHLNRSSSSPHPKLSQHPRQEQKRIRQDSHHTSNDHLKHQQVVAEKSNKSMPFMKSIRLQKGISTIPLNNSIPQKSREPHRRNHRWRLVHRNRHSTIHDPPLAQDQPNNMKTSTKNSRSTLSKQLPLHHQRNHRRRLRNRHNSTKLHMNNSLPSQRDQKQLGTSNGHMQSKAHLVVVENHKKHQNQTNRNHSISHHLQSGILGRQHRRQTVKMVNGSSPQRRRAKIHGHDESHKMIAGDAPITHQDHTKTATLVKSNYTFHRKRIMSNQLDPAMWNIDHVGQLQLHQGQKSNQRIHKRSIVNNDTYAEILKAVVFLDDQPNSDRHSQF